MYQSSSDTDGTSFMNICVIRVTGRETSSVTHEAIGELTIDVLLKRWPKTAQLFQSHHMACLGCVVAPFCQVKDAIAIYNLSPELFLAKLKMMIEQESGGSVSSIHQSTHQSTTIPD
jgi:hybrid cluster-associated redox disulfide protein